MPIQCPQHMFSNQVRGVIQARTQGMNNRRVPALMVCRITQRYRNISQPSNMTDAADRAAFGAAQKFLFAPAEQLDQRGAGQAVARVEVGQRAAAGEFVPGADELTVVAAIDAVADQRPQFQRDRAVVFDGEIRDAAARIQPVWRHDGAGRAGVDAGAAGTAVVGDRLGGR